MKQFAALLLLVGTIFSSCSLDCVTGTGDMITELRSVESFHSILLECSADVNIVQDQNINEPIVEVVAQAEILERLSLSVVHDQLVIDMTGCTINSTSPQVNITVPALQEIVLDGSGDIFGEDVLEGEKISIVVDGSGNIDLWLAYEQVEVLIDGSGDVTLQGKAKSMDVTVDGSGNLNAFALTSEQIEIMVDGSGDSRVNATQRLIVEVDGSGDVEYMGSPDVEIIDNGSGNVSSAE